MCIHIAICIHIHIALFSSDTKYPISQIWLSALILRKTSEKSLGRCNIVGATSSLKESLQKYFIQAILLNTIFLNRKDFKTNKEKKMVGVLKYLLAWYEILPIRVQTLKQSTYVCLGYWRGAAFLDWDFCSQTVWLSALKWFGLQYNNRQSPS